MASSAFSTKSDSLRLNLRAFVAAAAQIPVNPAPERKRHSGFYSKIGVFLRKSTVKFRSASLSSSRPTLPGRKSAPGAGQRVFVVIFSLLFQRYHKSAAETPGTAGRRMFARYPEGRSAANREKRAGHKGMRSFAPALIHLPAPAYGRRPLA